MRIIAIDRDEGGAVSLQSGDIVLRAMDCLGYVSEPYPEVGDTIDVEFSCLHGEEQAWEQIFGSNPDRLRQLVPTGLWSYQAFGEIVSLGDSGDEPQVACGVVELPLPVRTSDPRCLGEFVSFSVARLDAWRKRGA
ncbi:MAG: hypothetical protein QM766_00965 [Burkholderiaceae bacterium]